MPTDRTVLRQALVNLMVNAVPDLTRRAATAILGTIAAISMLSTFVRSPLEEAANALVTPNPAKAPWYFLWLQEIVTDTTFHLGSFTVNGAEFKYGDFLVIFVSFLLLALAILFIVKGIKKLTGGTCIVIQCLDSCS